MSHEVPGIETERLIFRGPTVADFDELVALWADPEVTRHISGKPLTAEESWGRLCRNIGHWVVMGFGYWVVRDRAGGLVGEVGFADWRREITPAIDAPEAGWVLARAAQGKGYATEAVRGILAWGERHFGNARAACIIEPANVLSVRVAEKCGFVRQGDATYRGKPSLMFVRPMRAPS